jgi:hypothetical protein
MAGATEKPGSFTRPWRLQDGDPKIRVLSEDEEVRRSSLPPIEVKVNAKKDSKQLSIAEYEQGTSGR